MILRDGTYLMSKKCAQYATHTTERNNAQQKTQRAFKFYYTEVMAQYVEEDRSSRLEQDRCKFSKCEVKLRRTENSGH
jgi:hypothetical protein